MDNQEHEHVFTELGGSIGRNPLNDWIICDHKRFISGKHAEIFFRDNSFFLTDTSTNGVYLNDGAEPIGNGNSIPLSQNDKLNFGELNLSVNIEEGQTSQRIQDTSANNTSDSSIDLFADLLGDFGAPAPQRDSTPYETVNSEANIDQLIGVSTTSNIEANDIEVTDPLAILDGKSSASNNSLAQEPLVADSFSRELLEGGSALNTPFNPPVGKPEAVIPENNQADSVIPNNWDPLADLLDDLAPPAPTTTQANGYQA
ncbi:MAG: FHA domain-containing protein, partial [Gammaproteobacteria bacterium]|nr:FHA domain-containing protein [Gammaproteobacteria bacterium]